jgi:hypothetical protein
MEKSKQIIFTRESMTIAKRIKIGIINLIQKSLGGKRRLKTRDQAVNVAMRQGAGW